MERFLDGMNAVDSHFKWTPLEENVPVLLGLVGWYNTYIAGHSSRAILPYCQGLSRFAAHIQQVDMESNGKSVSIDGDTFD